MKNISRFVLLSATVLALSPLAACTTPSVNNANAPARILAEFGQPFYVNAANVVVQSSYDPSENPKDISSSFPTPPDTALKRYAETRFKAAGGAGTFKFVIEDASVYREELESQNSAARWVGVDNRDRYTAVIKVVLYREGDNFGGAPGAMQNEIRAERTLTIPSNLSLNARDERFDDFLLQMLRDLDTAATTSLTNTLKLSTPEPAPSPGPYPVTPVDITPQHQGR